MNIKLDNDGCAEPPAVKTTIEDGVLIFTTLEKPNKEPLMIPDELVLKWADLEERDDFLSQETSSLDRFRRRAQSLCGAQMTVRRMVKAILR